MLHLSLICAALLNIAVDAAGDHPLMHQDNHKKNRMFIGFHNSSSEDGSIDYYSNTLLKSLEVQASGEVELTPDDREIKSISPNGYVIIRERNWLTYRALRLKAGTDGKIEKEYTIQGRDYPFDADAQVWLSGILPELVRETGLGAQTRIKRILEQNGVPAAIREIRWVYSNYAKKIYFEAILNHPELGSDDLQNAVETVAKEISSSSKLGDLLISTAGRFPEDSVLTETLIRAVKEISSSSKQSDVLMHIAQARNLNDPSALVMAQTIKSIASSSAQASALEVLAERSSSGDEVVEAYVGAVKTMSSSSAQGRALKALIRKKGMSDQAFIKILKSIEYISSSSVQGDVMEDIAYACSDHDPVLSAYLKAVSSISSSTTQGRAVMAMLKKNNVSAFILTKTLSFANEEIASRSVRDEITERVTEKLAGKTNP